MDNPYFKFIKLVGKPAIPFPILVEKTKKRESYLLFLVVNSISWFILTFIIIGNAAESYSFSKILSVVGSYFLALVVSAIIGGTLLYRKMRSRGSLLTWVLTGVAASLFYAFVSDLSVQGLMVSSVVLGASIGIGIPTCFSFFANSTMTLGRGKTGAIIFFLIQIVSAAIAVFISGSAAEYTFIALAIWRLSGIAGILPYQPLKTYIQEHGISTLSVLNERVFILYFVSWLLFALVNSIETPVLEAYLGNSYSNYIVATTLISSISALIGGVLCDLRGRKIVGILGFVILGIGYAFLSFLSGGSTIGIAQILYTVCDGTAWGILYVIFVFVLWGDLSEGKVREKFYLWGSMPFLFSSFISILARPFVDMIPIATSFPLASFFLFIAVLPLIYAPETMPEKALKDRDLKSYTEKALKQAAKQEEKKKSKVDDDSELEEKEVEDEADADGGQSPVYDEACKLAEKYY